MADETRADPIAERFTRETAQHEMTILHDDGLYRHVKFMDPKNSGYWYELITAPNSLTFRGDGDSFVFHRERDMFGFFRSNPDRSTHRISPGYWAEKLTSNRDCVKVYSREKFDRHVADILAEDEERWPGVTAAWAAYIDDTSYDTPDLEFEENARHALDSFGFGAKTVATCACSAVLEFDAESVIPLSWRDQHTSVARGHGYKLSHKSGYRFTDTWEWDLRDFDWWFLWACHGIITGIARYDAAKAAEPVRVRVGSASPIEPAELGPWLRQLPLRTILTERNGLPCQIATGTEWGNRSLIREFSALFVFGDPFELADGHEAIDQLAKFYAPFTVLALGTVQDGDD